MTVRYRTGDASAPAQRPVIIAHVVNNVGAWGRGFTSALTARWPQLEHIYRRAPRRLGEVILARVEAGITVANMCAQHGIGTGRRRVDYTALAVCLAVVESVSLKFNNPIVCPRIGCGLGGGDWTVVEALLRRLECDVFVYDPPAADVVYVAPPASRLEHVEGFCLCDDCLGPDIVAESSCPICHQRGDYHKMDCPRV